MLGAAVPFAHSNESGSEPLLWLIPLLLVSFGTALYAVGVLAYRARRGRRWSRWRTASWLTGTALVASAMSPAMTAITGDASQHMVQHLLLGMLGPLGLVMGAPVTLVLGGAPPSTGRRITAVFGSRPIRLLGHPVTAGVLSVGGVFVLYLTPLYALSADHDAVHALVHAHFLASGYLFAWAIAGPDPAPHRPSMSVRVAVLVLAGGAHSYLGKLLYSRAGELPPGAGHSAADLQAAAQWMYYGGDVTELLLACGLFAAWYRHRARGGRRGGGDRRGRSGRPPRKADGRRPCATCATSCRLGSP